MRVPIDNLTEFGVVIDVEDVLLPPNAWTNARNARFGDGSIRRMGGTKAILDPPSIAPYWVLYVTDSGKVGHVLYAGLLKVFEFSSGTHSDITRTSGGDYGATADGLWNGGILNGIPVINNGVDVPQAWLTISGGTPLTPLANWVAADRCKILRPFKNFLFALDITTSGTRFPHRVKISHPAAPGAVPSSWDETDATKDVVLRDIGDDESAGLVEAVPLGNIMVLYKDRTTHYAQFIGGTQKWRTDLLFKESGALGDHCAVAFNEGKQHFVATGEDIIVHNGQQRQSVIDSKLRKWLINNMDVTNFGRSFCYTYGEENECAFVFPLSGSTWPNLALVWNKVTNALTFREIDQASFIVGGQIPQETSDPWDSDTEQWNSDTGQWDVLAHQAFVRRLIQAKPTATKLLHLETTDQFEGVSFTGYVERTGLDVIGRDDSGRMVRDRNMYRLIKSIWPKATGAPFEIRIATQQEIDGAITWSAPQTFTPGTDKKVDFDLYTYLWGIRFEMATAGSTQLHSYQVDVEPLGDF